MRTENEKAPQIKVQILPSPCNVSFINHEHEYGNSSNFCSKLIPNQKSYKSKCSFLGKGWGQNPQKNMPLKSILGHFMSF